MAGWLAAVEERFLVRVSASTRPERWVKLYRGLTLPLIRRGDQVARRGQLAGRSWSVVCCGRPKRFRWLLSQLFDAVDPPRLAVRSGTTNPDTFDSVDADLLAVEVHPAFAPHFRDAGWIVVPESVRWRRRVADPLHFKRREGRGLRSDLALIAQLGYTMEESRSRADWVFFREQMLLPYVRGRFGDDAWEPSRGFLRAVGARAHLLFAVRDGRRVSALCVVPVGPRVWAPVLGVLGGSPELLREGAVAVLYKFLLEWGAKRGSEVADIGRTRPSMSDRVAWYKAKWGFRPAPDPLAHLVAIRLGPEAAVLQERLASRQILLHDEDVVRPIARAPDSARASGSPSLQVAPAAQEE